MGSVIDIDDSQRAKEYIIGVFRGRFPEADISRVEKVFELAEKAFQGGLSGYQTVDLKFHDFEHTIRGAVAMACFLDGVMQNHPKGREVGRDHFEEGIVGILFHDCGYLKETGDDEGTGAKFTTYHVARSCDFAHRVLAREGFDNVFIRNVCDMIQCTGLHLDTHLIHFDCEGERLAGYCLGTSDLLGQMADPRYQDKLEDLFGEFSEAKNSNPEKWTMGDFTSAEDLIRKTPGFYRFYVLKVLDQQLGGVFRCINDPYPDGENLYLKAIEANIRKIEDAITTGRPLTRSQGGG